MRCWLTQCTLGRIPKELDIMMLRLSRYWRLGSLWWWHSWACRSRCPGSWYTWDSWGLSRCNRGLWFFQVSFGVRWALSCLAWPWGQCNRSWLFWLKRWRRFWRRLNQSNRACWHLVAASCWWTHRKWRGVLSWSIGPWKAIWSPAN